MKKSVYLEPSILELSKIVMHEFWYDYVKRNYGKKSKIVLYWYIEFHCIHKTAGIHINNAEDIETRFDTSNCELDRP